MKLMYEMPAEDQAVYDATAQADEKLMYCVPFNVLDEKFVDGWTAVTDRCIYCILDGQLISRYELEHCTVFSTENLYGNCAFYGVVDGNTTMICQFLSGRNLPRYSVLVHACEDLAQKRRDGRAPGEPVVNNESEHFCPKCGRPFIPGTNICPFCRDTKEVYRKLWGLTKGLRLMLFFPLFVSVINLIIQFILPAIQRVAVNDYITNESI